MLHQTFEQRVLQLQRTEVHAGHARAAEGPVSHQALQYFIADSRWEAEPLWARLREIVPVLQRGELLPQQARRRGPHELHQLRRGQLRRRSPSLRSPDREAESFPPERRWN